MKQKYIQTKEDINKLRNNPFDEIKGSKPLDDEETEMVLMGITEAQTKRFHQLYSKESIIHAIDATNKAIDDNKIKTTPPKYFYGVIKNLE